MVYCEECGYSHPRGEHEGREHQPAFSLHHLPTIHEQYKEARSRYGKKKEGSAHHDFVDLETEYLTADLYGTKLRREYLDY